MRHAAMSKEMALLSSARIAQLFSASKVQRAQWARDNHIQPHTLANIISAQKTSVPDNLLRALCSYFRVGADYLTCSDYSGLSCSWRNYPKLGRRTYKAHNYSKVLLVFPDLPDADGSPRVDEGVLIARCGRKSKVRVETRDASISISEQPVLVLLVPGEDA